MQPRKLAVLAIGFAVSALFLWLVLRQLDLAEVGAAIASADPLWIAVAVMCFAFGYACRIQRWRIMLLPANPDLSFGRATVPFLASFATNNVLPFRAGDALRTIAFRNWLGIGPSVVLATLIVERLLDLLSLIVAFVIALFIFQHAAAQTNEVIGVGANVLILISVLLTITLLRPQLFERFTLRAIALLGRGAPRIATRLDGITANIFTTLKQQAQGPRMLKLLFWSFFAWIFEGGLFYATALAMPALTDAAAAWLAFPVATLATLIPAMPGHVGTFDFFASRAMVMLDNPATAAAAFALLAHFILWISATVSGGICLLIWSIRRDTGTKTQNQEFSQ